MLVDAIGVRERKVSTLPIAGIDTRQFQAIAEKDTEEIKTVVSTIGRLTEVKGYDSLIQTAQILKDNFQFTIAGDGEKYEELANASPSNVHFAGTIPNDDIPDFLNRSDIYFQPSRREGLCMTVIEAMACELPIVASSVGGITESVVDGETGFLCDPGDISCYAEHLEKLASDSSLREKMGNAGRERVKSHYSQRELADQFRKAVNDARSTTDS
jgi:glycosyltransferase involved in cell wall biosynthesis